MANIEWLEPLLKGAPKSEGELLDLFGQGTKKVALREVAPVGETAINWITHDIYGAVGTRGQFLDMLPRIDETLLKITPKLDDFVIGGTTRVEPVLRDVVGDTSKFVDTIKNTGEGSSKILQDIGAAKKAVNLEEINLKGIPDINLNVAKNIERTFGDLEPSLNLVTKTEPEIGRISALTSDLKQGLGKVTDFGISIAKPVAIIGASGLVLLAGANWILNPATGKVEDAALPGGKKGSAAATGSDACAALIAQGSMDASLLAVCQSCEASTGIAGVAAGSVTTKQGNSLVACIQGSGDKSGGQPSNGNKQQGQQDSQNTTGACSATFAGDAAKTSACQGCGGDSLDTSNADAVTAFKTCFQGKGGDSTTPTNGGGGSAPAGGVVDICQEAVKQGQLTADQLQLCLQCEKTLGLDGKDAYSLSDTEQKGIGSCIAQKVGTAGAGAVTGASSSEQAAMVKDVAAGQDPCADSTLTAPVAAACKQCYQQGMTSDQLVTCVQGQLGVTQGGVVTTVKKYAIPIAIVGAVVGVLAVGTHGTMWGKKGPKGPKGSKGPGLFMIPNDAQPRNGGKSPKYTRKKR